MCHANKTEHDANLVSLAATTCAGSEVSTPASTVSASNASLKVSSLTNYSKAAPLTSTASYLLTEPAHDMHAPPENINQTVAPPGECP